MIFENQYIQERIKKTQTLRDKGINPYPNQVKKGTPSATFLNECAYVHDIDVNEGEMKQDKSKSFTLTGRIKFVRIMGKAAFAKIEDSEGIVQIYYNRDDLPEGYYNNIVKKQVSNIKSMTKIDKIFIKPRIKSMLNSFFIPLFFSCFF